MPVRGKITALAAGAVVATCGVPAPASAAEPGFTVDPQSPAGVEYQVPLDSARGQGGGGTGHHGGGSLGGGGGGSLGGGGSAGNGGGTSSGGGSTGSPTLFGAGITPASAGSSGSQGAASGATGQNGAGAGARAASGGSDKSLGSALTASTHYSSTGPVAGLIAAILAAGAALGFFLRLRARRPRKIFS